MKLTILMPCLNEAQTLHTCIAKANKWIDEQCIDCEILIADNGSTDGSQKIAKSMGARVIDVKSRGYGSALYYGCLEASGQYIIMGDSDDSYDFSALSPFLEKLEQGYGLVMGNRFWGGIKPSAMPWKNRYIGNPILTWIGKSFFSTPIGDFHCGLRGVSKTAFLAMDLRTTGMEFASEMVIKASIFGIKIAEVPTTLSKDGRLRAPHLRPWRDGWRHLRFMLLFSPRWLFAIPGATLFLLSALIYVPLLFVPIRVGSIGLDIHTLFYAQTGMALGCIAFSFGIIVRMFAMREGLLLEHNILSKVLLYPILEIGTVCGILMISVGVYLGFIALQIWNAYQFGEVPETQLLRIVSLSTTMVILGGIIFMSSLIMGFLTLPTRKQRSTIEM